MNDAIYIDLIGKYLSGNLAEPEREQLMMWVEASPANRAFFEEMIQLWSISGSYEEQFEANTPEAWNTLETRLFGGGGATFEENPLSVGKTSVKIVRLSINKTILRVAAVILAVITGGMWLFSDFFKSQDQMLVFETSAKERKQIELPDGSIIWLNESTRLSYDQRFINRVVSLEGEAFFDVAHLDSKPFTILSAGTSTTVLGTTFNVRAYPKEDRIEVTVETGKVELRKADQPEKKVLLTAGKSGLFDKNTEEVSISEAPISNADAWKNQRLEFTDAPMRDVLEAARRFYGIHIEVENSAILNCPLTSNFEGPVFDNFIKTLEFATPFKVERHDSSYVIIGAGCK